MRFLPLLLLCTLSIIPGGETLIIWNFTQLATSNSDIQQYLHFHNTIRMQHGATNLTYAQDLAAAAQNWANNCKFKHSGGTLGPFGENLAAGAGSGKDFEYSIGQGIKSWTGEASMSFGVVHLIIYLTDVKRIITPVILNHHISHRSCGKGRNKLGVHLSNAMESLILNLEWVVPSVANCFNDLTSIFLQRKPLITFVNIDPLEMLLVISSEFPSLYSLECYINITVYRENVQL